MIRSAEASASTGFSSLTPHAFFYITQFLDVPSICKLSRTNKQLKELVDHPKFWISYYHAIKVPKILGFDDCTLRDPAFLKDVYKKLPSIPAKELRLVGMSASSTDFDQSIDRVLIENSRLFWSSTGSETTKAEEHLIFRLHEPAIVRSVDVVFYHQFLVKYYLARSIVICLGTNENEWIYRSKEFFVNDKGKVELHIEDQVCPAKYMKVLFIGKMGLQDWDNMYYIAVDRIKAKGITLSNPKCRLDMVSHESKSPAKKAVKIATEVFKFFKKLLKKRCPRFRASNK